MTQRKLNAFLPQPRYLWFLVLSYSMVMVLANWFDARLIRIFSLNTDAGTLIFPLTFLLSDLMTEVYGYQQARRAIWCGFLFNFIFILYGQIIIHLPSPDYAVISNQKFDELLSMNSRIIIASTMSYLCAEPLNSFIMAKLKILFSGHQLALRFVASTVIASVVDSFIFGTIAFYGLMSHQALFLLIITMWFLKVVIEVVGLPISLYLTKKLKEMEHLDVYDKKTNFTPFSLHVDYTERDNLFKE
ncbi:MAG TPA: queuosine precursor transporter [Gammaproteobacteria bacterium]|jgi:uncharacterized integral membrane protein (TIGR00697 family)|nr:queuosine precursor transporter [Gammaproteobacteria bacterium]